MQLLKNRALLLSGILLALIVVGVLFGLYYARATAHPVITPSNTYTPKPTQTITPSLTFTATITPSITPSVTPSITLTISKTRVNLSPELYLDENSSPENLRGNRHDQEYHYFSNRVGSGLAYQFGNEKWVTALTWTRVFPLNDDPGVGARNELLQDYIQVWRDTELLGSFPVDGIEYKPEKLLRYNGHWIFWFMNPFEKLGGIVEDGVLLNDLHHYDSAFGLFLLGGKPFFFFQRGRQLGISYNHQEIPLPYSHISYGPVCCDGGGAGHWNPRGTDKMVGFYVWSEKSEYRYSEYRYIEIGIK